MWFRFLAFPLALLAGLAVARRIGCRLVLALAYPNLPSLQALTEYQPKIPRGYSAEACVGDFVERGVCRRAVRRASHAILAARTSAS